MNFSFHFIISNGRRKSLLVMVGEKPCAISEDAL
jgi:hypothetical protein